MPPILLTGAQARQIDQVATEQFGIGGGLLMENAGRGCARMLLERGLTGPVAIFCGKGNNGGDGLVVARLLAEQGFHVTVLVVPPLAELMGDALANFLRLDPARITIIPLADEGGPAAMPDALDYFFGELYGDAGPEWIVDAMLGTGAKGAPRPPYDTLIEWINAEGARKLAIDVPSGLDCDTGEPSATTLRADLTATFVATKAGFANRAAAPYLGEVEVVDIGVPEEAIMQVIG